MTSNTKNSSKWVLAALAGVLVLAGVALGIRKFASNPSTDASAQITFQTPAEAAEALADAAKTGDQKQLARIFGVKTKALLSTQDPEGDKTALDAFGTKFQQMNRWIDMTDGSRVLYIGADNFAFPVPLAKNSSERWYFDGVAGAEEIRARNIGRNELLAIDACSALATAEEIYFQNSQGREYAQRIISTPGKQDGLYWIVENQGSSPLGELREFPRTSLVSYHPDKPFTIDGYSFRILTAQGDDARSGAKDYIKDGRMTRGFAILATPVRYAETGIMTFMISREGMVYEQDLGPDTSKLAAAIQDYNPDDNWSLVE